MAGVSCSTSPKKGKDSLSMELQALKLLVTEHDLSNLATKALELNEQLSDLEVRITTEAVVVAGVVHLFMRVPFETFWWPAVRDGKLTATLLELKVVGLPAGMLKGVLLRMLADEAEKEDALRIEGETVFVDADRLLVKNGLDLRMNLSALHCTPGQLVVEAASDGRSV
jgi:hypothetical protein